MMSKTILVDMDNTIGNLNKALSDKLKDTNPELALRCLNRKEFEFSGEDEKITRSLMNEPNFFANLEPMDGAIETINKWIEAGHSVYFCTRPLNYYTHCVKEKYDWIAKHFGVMAVRRLILCKDKTMVYGDILIDDAPEVIGGFPPRWKHVLFDQSYNASITTKQRVTTWRGLELSSVL